MSSPIHKLQLAVATALSDMPDVFSTIQWGGRAYKLPGPGSRGHKKPLLLAHVWLNDSPPALGVSFKLPPEIAADLVETHDFLAPHSFRTLAPSGWLTATITSARDCRTLIKLLHQSRAQYPISTNAEAPSDSRDSSAKRNNSASNLTSTSPIARRISSVMQAKKSEGWNLPDLDDATEPKPKSRKAKSPSRTPSKPKQRPAAKRVKKK